MGQNPSLPCCPGWRITQGSGVLGLPGLCSISFPPSLCWCLGQPWPRDRTLPLALLSSMSFPQSPTLQVPLHTIPSHQPVDHNIKLASIPLNKEFKDPEFLHCYDKVIGDLSTYIPPVRKIMKHHLSCAV